MNSGTTRSVCEVSTTGYEVVVPTITNPPSLVGWMEHALSPDQPP
ncbi:MAG: hypothetical protein NTZ39_02035 [Methanoregula sp.]|nr:hypothetical protein [Methanoregula sp.]